MSSCWVLLPPWWRSRVVFPLLRWVSIHRWTPPRTNIYVYFLCIFLFSLSHEPSKTLWFALRTCCLTQKRCFHPPTPPHAWIAVAELYSSLEQTNWGLAVRKPRGRLCALLSMVCTGGMTEMCLKKNIVPPPREILHKYRTLNDSTK